MLCLMPPPPRDTAASGPSKGGPLAELVKPSLRWGDLNAGVSYRKATTKTKATQQIPSDLDIDWLQEIEDLTL